MSVLVRMDMPENCKKCKNPICLWVDLKIDMPDVIAAVQDFRKKNDGGFPDFCPIICSIPEEHGRLVDERELFARCRPVKNFDNPDSLVIVMGAIIQSQTIVPAAAERK